MKTKPSFVHPFTAGTLCALALMATGTTTIPGRAAAAAAGDDAVTLRVVPERDYLYRKGPREIVVEVEVRAKRAESTHRSPVNVCVVLDHSGSMGGAKIESARQAARAALDRLEDDDIFSLVIYDDDVELLLPPERVGSSGHRDALKDRISRIQPGGGTALYAGVQAGAKQVRRFLEKERVNRIVLLSDGLANVGPSKTRDLTSLGRDLRGEGLSVTTIGLGEDFNEDLMSGLAESSHANYYYVKDIEKLPGILTEEFNSAGVRVAGDIRIRIEAPEGVRLREVIGHPEIECKERVAEIKLPELFGSEYRLFHLRCAVVDETSGESQSLARVAMGYEDATSRERRAQDASASVRLTDDTGKSESSVQNAVAQNVAVEQNRLDKEAAVKLADSGRGREAAALLHQRASANAALPVEQQMPGMTQENRKLETWANELGTTGVLQNTSRKAAQYDNYQDKYQKKAPAPTGR